MKVNSFYFSPKNQAKEKEKHEAEDPTI